LVASRTACTIFGLASANLVVVKNCAWLSGPPITSGDDSTTCAPGTFFSSRNVNGGIEK
jgi:hypothetical protein